MGEPKTYTGGCHCGEVRFEVTADICERYRLQLHDLPEARGAVDLRTRGEVCATGRADDLRDYQFGKRRLHHLFCAQCGVGSFSRGTSPDGSETVALNVRCLDDVDIAALTPKLFDGRSQ